MFTTSSSNHGTLSQMCSLLGRLPAAKDPKKDMNASTDFLVTVLKGHYIAAACNILGLEKADSPIPGVPDHKKSSLQEQQAFMFKIAGQVVDQCGLVDEAVLFEKETNPRDGVYSYTRVLCHCFSLALEFMDAWSEGDGDRICRCWKIFMLHFRSGTNTKYALQALHLQFQLLQLSPSVSHQLKWGRFVNYRGGAGNNIPCDLHNEHVNRGVKEIINHMGANLTEAAVRQAGQSVSMIGDIIQNFDTCTGLPFVSSAHSTRSDEEDVLKIVNVVRGNDLLTVRPGRAHSQFPGMTPNPFSRLNKKDTLQWIVSKQMDKVDWNSLLRFEDEDEDAEDTTT